MNAIPDILHAVRGVAGDDAARFPVVKSKGRDLVVLAVKDARLTVRCRGWEAGKPSAQTKPFLIQEPCDRRAVPEIQRASQIGVGERVDLERDETAAIVPWTSL